MCCLSHSFFVVFFFFFLSLPFYVPCFFPPKPNKKRLWLFTSAHKTHVYTCFFFSLSKSKRSKVKAKSRTNENIISLFGRNFILCQKFVLIYLLAMKEGEVKWIQQNYSRCELKKRIETWWLITIYIYFASFLRVFYFFFAWNIRLFVLCFFVRCCLLLCD